MDPAVLKLFASAWKVYGLLGLIFVSALVCAYLIFRFLGAKWLDAKFNERLESYKHAQQQEIERLRYKINSLFDRTIKIHQLEFENLPETWRKLTDAFFFTKETTFSFENFTNIGVLSPDQAIIILKEDGFKESDINVIMEASDRQGAYMKLMSARRLQKTAEVVRDFRVHIRKYGIFVRPEIRKNIELLETLIAEALTEYSVSMRYAVDFKEGGKVEALQSKGESMYLALEKQVQDRLWNSLAEPKD